MSMESNSYIPPIVVVAYDATKDRNVQEFKRTINGIRILGDDILQPGNTLMVMGVLHRVLHPFGYHLQASPESFNASTIKVVEDEVSKKVDLYVKMLQESAEDCQDKGVDIEVKISAGTPIRKVVLQEVINCNATWLILDRHLRRDWRFYLKHIPCKVAFILENFSVEILRSYSICYETDPEEHKLVFSMFKHVPLTATVGRQLDHEDYDNDYSNYNENSHQHQQQHSVVSCASYPASVSMDGSDYIKSDSYKFKDHGFSSVDDHNAPSPTKDKSGRHAKSETKLQTSTLTPKRSKSFGPLRSSDAPILCRACGMTTEVYIKESMRFSYGEIQLATNNFSEGNMLGEGGYGYVYKGELKDGQIIAAKVHKEASSQGFNEFHSEVYVLSFARHKNIVMLLGYCCKENLNILVYEYICNKSLEWHLFHNTETVLEWPIRHAIAIGTAKGLRFLHEECRGSPIIHRDLRPSNILLTHDFVPMLGDFGLARWKKGDGPVQTQILGTLGYLAPEYAENGIVSVKTDVYAFGIVLIQLISGRKALDSTRDEHQQSIRQWAEQLIEDMAMHKLIDPRLLESYDTYELYHMARIAYLCVQTDPANRPSMAQVVRILEGDTDQFNHLADQFIPHFTK